MGRQHFGFVISTYGNFIGNAIFDSVKNTPESNKKIGFIVVFSAIPISLAQLAE